MHGGDRVITTMQPIVDMILRAKKRVQQILNSIIYFSLTFFTIGGMSII